MTSTVNFIDDNNVQMLWELIIDGDGLQKNPRATAVAGDIFKKLIPKFYEKEKNISSDLSEMNKKFSFVIMNILNNKMTAPPPPPKITFAEIKSEKIALFENEFSKKQSEFNNTLSMVIPETPNFRDKQDLPIAEMELLIQQTIAQRKFDTNYITEKLQTPPVKYIKIDKSNKDDAQVNYDIIDLERPLLTPHPKNNRHISWDTDNNDVNVKLDKMMQMLEFIISKL